MVPPYIMKSHGGDEFLQLPRSWYCEHCVWGGIFGRVGLSLQDLRLGPVSHQLAIEFEFNKLFKVPTAGSWRFFKAMKH